LGKRVHSPAFQLVYHPHDELHVSVVVSKKNAKKAVLRNKIRRRIYDIVRHYRDAKGLTGVYIFLTKEQVTHTPYTSLKEEVEKKLNTITVTT
jgi:ribonuclease P protein component